MRALRVRAPSKSFADQLIVCASSVERGAKTAAVGPRRRRQPSLSFDHAAFHCRAAGS
jgi:hypothetical protein